MSDQLSRHAVSATHEVAKALESAQTDGEWHEAQKKVAHAKQIATKLGKRGTQDMESGELMLKNARCDIADALNRAEKAKKDAADADNMLRKAQNDEETARAIGRKGHGDKAAADKIMNAVIAAEIAFHEEDIQRRQSAEDKKRKDAEEQERAANLRRLQREKEAHDLWSRQERGKNVSSAFKSAGHHMCKCDKWEKRMFLSLAPTILNDTN